MRFGEYIAEVERDARAWMVENIDYLSPNDDMIDELWTVDEVTGNGSGSYTFSTAAAWDNIAGSNWCDCLLFDDDFVFEVESMGETIGELFKHGPEYIDVTARVLALHHIDFDEIVEELFDGWSGAGWYSIKFSDGGQDWTNNGPVWMDDPSELFANMQAARECATDTHIPAAEYLGDDEDPEEA